MDIFDNVLPFLILFVYIISIFWKKRNQDTGEDRSEEKPSSAQKWLENLMGQISEGIEQQKPEPKPAPPKVVWEKNDGVKKPPPIRKTRAQKDRAAMQAADKKAPPEVKPEPPGLMYRCPSGPAYSRKMLRDRIIWAEILGPPVALREKDNQ